MRMLRSASGRVCLLLFAACTMPAYANVVVTTYLNLTQLTITPQAGTLDILLPWTASAFADAHDSIGGTSQQSNSVDDSSISASASTTLANAAGSAATSPPAGTSSSGVSIAGLNASAASTGRGRIAGSFQIIGTPDPVLVHISAALSGLQDLFTDANGVSASSEIIFSFKLDSEPGPDPFYDSIKSIGPNQSLSAP